MWQEMGKNLHHQESHISLENHSPGCMWGILNHFHHNRWHHVKKRLPRRRHGLGKHSTDQESTWTTLEAAEVQENIDSLAENSAVDTKSLDPSPAPKSSMKSRIKALITEEMSKRRGRHRRTTSCPTRTQLDRTISFHRLELSDLESPALNNSNDDVLGCHDSVHSAALLDPLLPRLGEEHGSNISACELCATMLNLNYSKQIEVNKLGRQPVRDHILLRDKLIYAIEPSKCDSLQESKLFMDALDLLNLRKEVFLKILQDPSSSLAHQLHCRRTPNLRFGLTKSVSFPVSGSSARRAFKSDNSTTKQENRYRIKEEDELQHCVEVTEDFNKHLATLKGLFTENGSPEQFLRELELSDNASPTLGNMLRKRHDNKVILKRFKNLREKLKHVIRDRKKEKNRIIMDAVHHKIPYGRSVSSKNLNDDGDMTPEIKADKFSNYNSPGSCGSDQLGSDFGKSPQQPFKRTSSFNESFNRYNRLLEISLNREAKDHISHRLRFRTADSLSPIPSRPAILGRILSLPDLRSYSSIHIDDSASTSSLHTADMVAAGNISIGEQKPLRLGSENKVLPLAISESESQENLMDAGETFDDSADSKTWESASSHDFNLEPVPSSAPQPSKSDQVSENESNYQEDGIGQGLAVSVSEESEFSRRLLFPTEEDSSAIQQDLPYLDSSTVSENMVDIDTPGIQLIKQFYNDLLHVQVDTKNEAEFNFVKDVLELSGFSRDEILGKWHSAEHPVNPLVFEEVEGCLVAQPECYGNEEGGSCDHLLLFDLINEVLLDIHERSFCYWPMPLTSRSHIHQMPKGYHVLEEVWAEISRLLNWGPEIDQAIDDAVSRDLAKHDGWMNLQLDTECVGLEMEDLIFDDLLEEIILT
ncbi:hypothetical protein Pfo_004356 [Paulownia fortunei]|nr:hypothetical protein Pfo_004356 [Paulownia fortunei]